VAGPSGLEIIKEGFKKGVVLVQNFFASIFAGSSSSLSNVSVSEGLDNSSSSSIKENVKENGDEDRHDRNEKENLQNKASQNKASRDSNEFLPNYKGKATTFNTRPFLDIIGTKHQADPILTDPIEKNPTKPKKKPK
jgi:hypothetical protein